MLILSGIKPIFAQQKDINAVLQYFDAETTIPEEDLTLINEIISGQWIAGKDLANQITKLSIIDYQDEELLKNVKDDQSLLALSRNENASPFLRELIEIIANFKARLAELGDLLINQYIVFDEDNRYRWNINYHLSNYSFGAIAERDPEEAQILDHASFYLREDFKKSELIVGDYQIVSGFGLWSWRSVSTRKSFESIASLPRIGRGVMPYRSANEYWYIRGVSYTINSKYGDFSLAGGITKQDGKIDDDGNISLSTSGLHTGETTIEQANNITESLIIGQWNYKFGNSEVVTSIAGTNWKDKDEVTTNDWCGSFAFNNLIKNGNFFGEIGRGYNNSQGAISGLRLKYSQFMYLISARYYSKGYTALRSNPFAEWVGNDRNEFGLYQGITFKRGHNNIILFGDLFRNINSEDDYYFPATGQETGIRWEWRKGSQYQRIQWKHQKKSLEDAVAYINDDQYQNEKENTYKYSGVFQLKDFLWGKLQLTYADNFSSDIGTSAFGIDTQIWWNLNSTSIYFDLLTTFINEGSAWIYFWDVNLPGEMTTRVYTKDSISPAIKVLYHTNSGFELGFRVRAIWKEFDFKGTPDLFGALALEVLL